VSQFFRLARESRQVYFADALSMRAGVIRVVTYSRVFLFWRQKEVETKAHQLKWKWSSKLRTALLKFLGYLRLN